MMAFLAHGLPAALVTALAALPITIVITLLMSTGGLARRSGSGQVRGHCQVLVWRPVPGR
jgi:hypothetical protein